MVQGTPDTDPVCPGVPDSDCPPGLSDGTGHNLVINANLIQGNSADSGSGGGIRLNQVNGTDVSTFPRQPALWNSVNITNNIINNNIAGWDGAGISLQDALNVSILNNTIAHNDSLASSGVLTFSVGTPQASAPPGDCHNAAGTTSCPQVAGVASARNSTLLTETFVGPAANPTCPAGQAGGNGCRTYSNPILGNNIIWQNRSFYIGISGAGTGTQNQQNLVSLYDAFTSTPAPAQTTTGTGSCPAFPTGSYWDIGVRGDTGPTNHTGGTLHPTNTVLTSTSGGYANNNNSATAPPVVSQFCNGSRVPPECSVANGCGGPKGFGVPPGISDAVTPNPVFSLTPSATVDEGNNWINVSWGPLALTNPSTLPTGGNYGAGPLLANYSLTRAIDSIAANVAHPVTDFFGHLRPEFGEATAGGHFDPGAVEFGSTVVGTASFTVTPSAVAFGNQPIGSASAAATITVTNTGNEPLSGGTFTFAAPTPFTRAGGSRGGPGTCGATLAVGALCTYNVVFTPPAGTPSGTNFTGSLAVAFTGATGTGTPVTLTGTGVAPGRLAFTSATNGTLSGAGVGRTLTFTIPSPRAPVTSVVTITNTGAGPLQITTETLAVNIGGLYGVTGTTCSFTTPLAPAGTCTVSIRYATPTTQPTFVDLGLLTAANNGTGTFFGVSTLNLSAR
jgi:hypothetical protein